MNGAPRVLAFGTYDIRTHPRVAVLLDGLRAHGWPVQEINRTLGLDTAARVAMLRQPWRVPRLLKRLAICWARLIWDSRKVDDPDIVLVGYLGHFDVLLARRLFRHATLVLDQLVFAADTATDRGVRGNLRTRVLRRLDILACRAADIVLVDTPENAELVPAAYSSKAVVVPVGAPDAFHRVGSTRPERESGLLRVVFYGLFTPLQGTVTIAEAGALLDPQRVRLTLVGAGQDLTSAQRAAGTARITWVPWIDAEDLPTTLGAFDVCIGIAGTTAKAKRVVPNKIFQGAAAGCAIVTSDTPPQRRVLGDAAMYFPPGDAAALASVLHLLAADPSLLQALGTRARSRARESFTPHAIAQPLVDALVPAGDEARR